ncbi:MAG: hypothetical protein H7242_01415, partial [Microbacteriaceae bacterium]|nr:hypothetical protein [Burkholderiaceae bacterium]
VSHHINSVRAVADRALYLDDQTRTMTALGTPQDLLQHGPAPVRRFFQRSLGAHRPDAEASGAAAVNAAAGSAAAAAADAAGTGAGAGATS